MPLPFPADNINSTPTATSVCDSFQLLLQSIARFKANLGWQSEDGTGAMSIPFARELAAITTVPGIILPYRPTTTSSDPGVAWSDAEKAVRQLWWTDDEIAADSGTSFWRICDGNNGTPDLKDRFLKSGSDTVKIKEPDGNANSEVKLKFDDLPPHWHPVGYSGPSGNGAKIVGANRTNQADDPTDPWKPYQGGSLTANGLQGARDITGGGVSSHETHESIGLTASNMLGTLPELAETETEFTSLKTQTAVKTDPLHYTLVFMMRTTHMGF